MEPIFRAMATQVFLLRHGETAWSVTGQHTGGTDLPLTTRGEQRAAEWRLRLRDVAFAQVWTSPLQRARRTCELAGFGAVAREEPDLREWDYGADEGRTTAAIRAQRPGWDVFRDGCPQGESPEEIGARADRIVQALRAEAGSVAVFSHGHFLRVLAMRWLGLPVATGRHFALETATLSILGHAPGAVEVPVIALWNAGAAVGAPVSPGSGAPAGP